MGGATNTKISSLTTECVLLLQNVFSYYFSLPVRGVQVGGATNTKYLCYKHYISYLQYHYILNEKKNLQCPLYTKISSLYTN